jgi:hypothetical protein
LARFQVNRRALDARSADVDSKALHAASSLLVMGVANILPDFFCLA